jgi:hypothetical protein
VPALDWLLSVPGVITRGWGRALSCTFHREPEMSGVSS